MNLTSIIDILIDDIYNKKVSNNCVSHILKSHSIEYSYEDSYIICSKIESLPYFTTINVSSQDGADLILSTSIEGVEFVDDFQTYANYLHQQQIKQELEQIKIKEKEQRELETHVANINSSKATVSAAKSAEGSYEEAIKSRNASYVSVFFAGVAILISIIEPFENENETKEAYKELNERIDSLSKIQSKTQQAQKDSLIQNEHNAKSK